MKHFFITLGIALLLFGCKDNKYQEQEQIVTALTVHPGQQLMENYCSVCHTPQSSSNKNRIAPPMIRIQEYYIDKNTSFEDFKKDFVDFLNTPSIEKAKMKGAVEKYGLMPYQRYPQEVLFQIAEYLYYNNPLDEEKSKTQETTLPIKSNSLTNAEKQTLGLNYANTTRQLLGQNLMGAIQKEGTMYALEFCNIEAIPLTRQMEEKHDAVIKRVSDKNRNPNNAANDEELYYITHFQKEIAAGQEPRPVVLQADNQTRFYYPIITNAMCLQCHGKPENIQPDVLDKIYWLYPDDLATGYGENEVRGIWSIWF